MQIGVIGSLYEGSLNDREGKPDGLTPRFADLQRMALAAEAAELDSFWVRDHLLYRDESHGEVGCWEGMTFLSALAASTTRITVGILVACTAYRNPALLAKMAESVDEISGGRFVLGLGCGWHKPEFVSFGYPFDHRVQRFSEAIEIISELLNGNRVTFHGQYYSVDAAVLRPRGPSSKGPPLWVGAKGPRMLRLVARYADAWNTDWVGRPGCVSEMRRRMVGACAAEGRDPATLPITVQTRVCIAERCEAADPAIEIAGSVAKVAEELQGFARAGVAHAIVDVKPGGLRGVQLLGQVNAFLLKGGTTPR